MHSNSILLIDDDTELQTMLRSYLRRAGFNVSCAETAHEGLRLLKTCDPELVVLDIFLPDDNGIDLCGEIRQRTKVPIILISAKGDESDKVLGLGLGADDFLTKPFSLNEFVARAKAQVRRYEYLLESDDEKPDAPLLVSGVITINAAERHVTCCGEEVHLTATEFNLLYFLVRNEGKVYDKDTLYLQIWGSNYCAGSRPVAVYIRRLRQKLEQVPEQPEMILNVWGVGYKYLSKDGSYE
jgi:DNA-binding response OmpR family regulator